MLLFEMRAVRPHLCYWRSKPRMPLAALVLWPGSGWFPKLNWTSMCKANAEQLAQRERDLARYAGQLHRWLCGLTPMSPTSAYRNRVLRVFKFVTDRDAPEPEAERATTQLLEVLHDTIDSLVCARTRVCMGCVCRWCVGCVLCCDVTVSDSFRFTRDTPPGYAHGLQPGRDQGLPQVGAAAAGAAAASPFVLCCAVL